MSKNRNRAYWSAGRLRKKAGRAVSPVEYGPEVIEAMLLTGMSEADSRDKAKVRAALEKVVQDWATRCRK